ncbi:MAG TPA: hypothetical protein VFX37_07195 [Pseudolabrys sp.]|nr:hypothetical protein [Pseudolabrys sp.]
MRRFLLACAGLALLAVATPAGAADMAVPAKKHTQVAAAANVECIRWVRQNWSWYNYCGPIRYEPRRHYDWWIW